MLKPTKYDWANVNRMLPSRKEQQPTKERRWGNLVEICRERGVDPRPIREVIKNSEVKGESITFDAAIDRYLENRQ